MTGNGGHGGADQEKTGRFVFEYELGEYFWRFQTYSGPKRTNGEFGVSKTPKPPELPLKQGKTSQHHNWPRYMDWPQIGPKSAIKLGKNAKRTNGT